MMNHKQWRERQRQSLGITDEQLECPLETAKVAAVVTGGSVGYSALRTGITMMALSASEIAEIAIEYRCPYCGSLLATADATRDGEALHCADCGQRVEFFDALGGMENRDAVDK